MAKTKTPAVRYLRYNIVNSGVANTETSHYIDLARDLSAINRRLMQQGRNYHVKRISIVSANTIPSPGQQAGRISFSTIPQSWTAFGAWKRANESWKKMQAKATLNHSGDVRPRYNDFKVYLSDDHRTGTKPTPVDNGGNLLSLGEWEYSKFQSPDGTTGADEYVAHMLGGHTGAPGTYTAIGLIQSFADSRGTVTSDSPLVPSTADNDPLANLFDDGTTHDEIIANMRNDNDAPPYDQFNYPGEGVNHPKPLVVQETTLGADGRATVGGFAAMCGLVEIECSSPVAEDVFSVLIELKEGSFKGIAAEAL